MGLLCTLTVLIRRDQVALPFHRNCICFRLGRKREILQRSFHVNFEKDKVNPSTKLSHSNQIHCPNFCNDLFLKLNWSSFPNLRDIWLWLWDSGACWRNLLISNTHTKGKVLFYWYICICMNLQILSPLIFCPLPNHYFSSLS